MNFTWLQENALVIGFYLVIGLIIYFNRKRFEFQGIVALFKTKFGIKQMKTFATPLPNAKDLFGRRLFRVSLVVLGISLFAFVFGLLFGLLNDLLLYYSIFSLLILSFFSLCVSIVFFRQIKLAGTLGIYVGVLGMLFMLGLIFFGLYQLFFDPSAPPMFAPVFPGISIPGSPFKLPLFEGLIALLVVVVIHEFSHGVVSKAYKIPIKSSGFVMFGPLPGAFVEPDEKKLKKSKPKEQLSIYAAGPFSNILLAAFVFILMFFITLLSFSLYEPSGVVVDGFIPDSGYEARGVDQLSKGEIILMIGNESVRTSFQLMNVTVTNYGPGDEVLFVTDRGERIITLGADPRNESLPLIGIYLDNAARGTTALSDNSVFKSVYFWLFGHPFSTNLNNALGLVALIFVLSFGIGIVNLLPAGPLDGGRMFFVFFKKKLGEKRTLKVLSFLSWTLLFLVLALVFIPIIRAVI